MKERRWHRWAAPVGVALTTAAGAAYLAPDDRVGHLTLAPAETYSQLGHTFGGGTATVVDLQPVSFVSFAGSATVATAPPHPSGGA